MQVLVFVSVGVLHRMYHRKVKMALARARADAKIAGDSFPGPGACSRLDEPIAYDRYPMSEGTWTRSPSYGKGSC